MSILDAKDLNDPDTRLSDVDFSDHSVDHPAELNEDMAGEPYWAVWKDGDTVYVRLETPTHEEDAIDVLVRDGRLNVSEGDGYAPEVVSAYRSFFSEFVNAEYPLTGQVPGLPELIVPTVVSSVDLDAHPAATLRDLWDKGAVSPVAGLDLYCLNTGEGALSAEIINHFMAALREEHVNL